MSVGPITIFDKSALQALSVDEAALFGQFYRTVITPLFFVETMADLEKKVARGKTPEQIVGVIAAKTANLTADPNAHHDRLVVWNLLGRETVMDGRPHVVGGRAVRTEDGRRGIVFDAAPEAEALRRWQLGQFLEVERKIARWWRSELERRRVNKFDVDEIFRRLPRPRDLADVKRYADLFTTYKGGPAFLAALDILEVPSSPRADIFLRWLDHGSPPISEFAPYAAYVATVHLFFRLAVSLGLISGERPSNAVDIAYLYYLPFCMVFTSSDKLHKKTAPLFLRQDQVFVAGEDLKADLKRLDAYFSALPADVLARGVYRFELPFDSDFLATKLWKQFLPGFRAREGASPDVPTDSPSAATLMEKFREAVDAPHGPPVSGDEADFFIIQREYPEVMGKWRIYPEDVARRSRENSQKRATDKNEPSGFRKPG